MDRFECRLDGPENQLELAVEAIKHGYPGIIDTPIGWRREKIANESWIHFEAWEGEEARSAISRILWDFPDVKMSEFGRTVG